MLGPCFCHNCRWKKKQRHLSRPSYIVKYGVKDKNISDSNKCYCIHCFDQLPTKHTVKANSIKLYVFLILSRFFLLFFYALCPGCSPVKVLINSGNWNYWNLQWLPLSSFISAAVIYSTVTNSLPDVIRFICHAIFYCYDISLCLLWAYFVLQYCQY